MPKMTSRKKGMIFRVGSNLSIFKGQIKKKRNFWHKKVLRIGDKGNK